MNKPEKIDFYKPDETINYYNDDENINKSLLERIVEKVAVATFALGSLYLAGAMIFGGDKVREQIAYAAKTVMVLGPGGNGVAAQILSGNIDSSVREWLDYPNQNADNKYEIKKVRK